MRKRKIILLFSWRVRVRKKELHLSFLSFNAGKKLKAIVRKKKKKRKNHPVFVGKKFEKV